MTVKFFKIKNHHRKLKKQTFFQNLDDYIGVVMAKNNGDKILFMIFP